MTQKTKATIPCEVLSAEGHDLCLLKMVVAGNLSFNFVDSDEFKEYIAYVGNMGFPGLLAAKNLDSRIDSKGTFWTMIGAA
jgi:hypothetical protein